MVAADAEVEVEVEVEMVEAEVACCNGVKGKSPLSPRSVRLRTSCQAAPTEARPGTGRAGGLVWRNVAAAESAVCLQSVSQVCHWSGHLD